MFWSCLMISLLFVFQDCQWGQLVPMETNVRADLSVTTGEEQAWSAVSVVIITMYRVSVCLCPIVQDIETMLKNSIIFMSDGRIEKNRARLVYSVHSGLVHIYVRLHRHMIYCCNFIVNLLKIYVRCINLLWTSFLLIASGRGKGAGREYIYI